MSSPAVCDIADTLYEIGLWRKFPFQLQNTPGRHRQDIQELQICGPAYTAQVIPTVEDGEVVKNYDGHFVDHVPAGSVVVISGGQSMDHAIWGGLLSRRAQMLQARGAVVEGNCRDLEEFSNFEFPVFSTGVSTAGAKGKSIVKAINVPVTIQTNSGNMTVNPGDIVLGDINGIAVVPSSKWAEVKQRSVESAAIDQQCMEAIAAGVSIQKAFRDYRGSK